MLPRRGRRGDNVSFPTVLFSQQVASIFTRRTSSLHRRSPGVGRLTETVKRLHQSGPTLPCPGGQVGYLLDRLRVVLMVFSDSGHRHNACHYWCAWNFLLVAVALAEGHLPWGWTVVF